MATKESLEGQMYSIENDVNTHSDNTKCLYFLCMCPTRQPLWTSRHQTQDWLTVFGMWSNSSRQLKTKILTIMWERDINHNSETLKRAVYRLQKGAERLYWSGLGWPGEGLSKLPCAADHPWVLRNYILVTLTGPSSLDFPRMTYINHHL